MLDQFFCGGLRRIQQITSRDAAIILDPLEDLLLLFLPHPRQLADLALARQLLYAFEIANLKCVPEQRNGLWPKTLNLEQIEHRGPVLLQQFTVQPQLSFAENFLDVLAHALADAGNLQQLFWLTN